MSHSIITANKNYSYNTALPSERGGAAEKKSTTRGLSRLIRHSSEKPKPRALSLRGRGTSSNTSQTTPSILKTSTKTKSSKKVRFAGDDIVRIIPQENLHYSRANSSQSKLPHQRRSRSKDSTPEQKVSNRILRSRKTSENRPVVPRQSLYFKNTKVVRVGA